jgi:DNA modification methylase
VSVELLHGDCVELMRAMPECSVDSIVTDPPYGLEFMGKEWDSFKTGRSANYAKGGDLDRDAMAERSGKGGAGPSYVNRPAKRCADCGKQAWSGSPCKCDEPRWVLDNSPLHAFQAWFEVVAVEALRVLKPGGHLLAFGGTRTYHRMACAIEDAGFEIRDSIHWVYGSGFPKSLNIGKAIDKAAGAEREVVGERKQRGRAKAHDDEFQKNTSSSPVELLTKAATEEAARWEGWGTALKPAHEPVVVARKPLSGTVAGNVLTWGTGGLNIDGCRVGTDGGGTNCGNRDADGRCLGHDNAGRSTSGETVHGANGASGRWPANIVLDGAAAAALDQQSGDRPAGTFPTERGKSQVTAFASGRQPGDQPAHRLTDKGGASRFFTQADFGPDDWPFVYQAKPSKRERNAGLDGLPEREWRGNYGDGIQDNRPHTPEGYKYESTTRNHHPTVKPVALMRHLVRLVTPPGGTVLDPFAGSGTTLVAAVLEGMNAIGCEMTDEYLPIIRGRVAWAEEQADAEQPRLL